MVNLLAVVIKIIYSGNQGRARFRVRVRVRVNSFWDSLSGTSKALLNFNVDRNNKHIIILVVDDNWVFVCLRCISVFTWYVKLFCCHGKGPRFVADYCRSPGRLPPAHCCLYKLQPKTGTATF